MGRAGATEKPDVRGNREEREQRGVRGEGKASRVKRKGEGVTHCETPST